MDGRYSILSLLQVFHCRQYSSSKTLLLSHFISTVKILAIFRLGVVLFVIASVFCSSLVRTQWLVTGGDLSYHHCHRCSVMND